MIQRSERVDTGASCHVASPFLETLKPAADPSAANQKLSRSDIGQRALHLAAARGHLEAVRTLLAHGADPKAADDAGNTPLATAEKAGHAEVAAALGENAGG